MATTRGIVVLANHVLVFLHQCVENQKQHNQKAQVPSQKMDDGKDRVFYKLLF